MGEKGGSLGAQPGEAEPWELRDLKCFLSEESVSRIRVTAGFGKTEVSGDLEKSSFVE